MKLSDESFRSLEERRRSQEGWMEGWREGAGEREQRRWWGGINQHQGRVLAAPPAA